MVAIVRGSIPADEFALNHVLRSNPNVQIEAEQVVESGEEAVMPLMWVRNGDRTETDAAIKEDPSVDESTLLAEFEDEYLYRMKWTDHVKFLLEIITNSEATILDAIGQQDRWHLRILYPGRELFSHTRKHCDSHGLTFDIEAIRKVEGEPSGRYGLTEKQYHALLLAIRWGYFSVPREISLEELARKSGVSHQALSERLRRGTETLIKNTLNFGHVEETTEEYVQLSDAK